MARKARRNAPPSGPARAAVIYDSLFGVTMGGGERLYGRLGELLESRDIRTDYITRQFDERSEASDEPFRVVGVWRGSIYDAHGIRTTSSAVAFAFGVFRYLVRRRRDYEIVIASALPVLTALAARSALIGSRTRVVADWLEVWSAAKWREYSGPVAGTIAFLLQWLGAHAIREHTADSRFTADKLEQVRRGVRPIVLGLFDLVVPGAPQDAADPPYSLFIGRLIPDKGVTAIPPALAIARVQIADLRAKVVGDGPDRAALIVAIHAAGLSADVDVLGRVSDDALDELRAGASVLVAPSIREGFGLAVAEASAWGVPAVVVAHEDNAAVDLVVDGVNGFVVAPGDPHALAAGIVEAIRGGSTLRRSSAQWFAGARVARSLSASLDALLAEPRR